MEKTSVLILSKPQFNGIMEKHGINDDTVKDFDNTAFISINDTNGDYKTSWFDKNHENVLRLWFDDVSTDLELSPTNRHECKAMAPWQALEIFTFMKVNSTKNFIVHCAAGISRSGAVGQFINDYLGGDKERFKRTNPHILPNAHISLLLNTTAWNE